jgi:uncharacterized protein (TIGR00730 family)
VNKIITVFGSSRPREGEAEYAIAYDVGKELGQAGFSICNGGYGGIMEASAKGAKAAGGSTIGVTAAIFQRSANKWIDREIHTATLIDRLMKLVELGDGYVVLKGGTGTLLELAAVWEFVNKGIMKEKPIMIVGDFWNVVVETLRSELLWEATPTHGRQELGECTRLIQRVEGPSKLPAVLTAWFSSHAA